MPRSQAILQGMGRGTRTGERVFSQVPPHVPQNVFTMDQSNGAAGKPVFGLGRCGAPGPP
jgi:hypothetical protein